MLVVKATKWWYW